jgi:general nucleoside transport system ATP-binding protein
MAGGTGSAGPANDPRPLFGAYGIVKRFGTFTANDHIDLEIHTGEIHALLGENGAGKSTLMKILYGLLEPTEGVVTHRGAAVRLRNPEAARRLGIGMVFQHFSLCENLTVAENIALVMERSLRRAALAERIAAGLVPLGRRAPAHRDRAMPAPGPEARDPRRADLGADAG